MQKLTVIIPTYNERDNITPLVEKIAGALAGNDYEILFIDDNSLDGTADAVRSLAPKYPVKVIVRKNERGLASAVVHGFKNASGDVFAVMDADLQHPPEVLADMLKAIHNADVVVGSRYVKGGSVEGWGMSRRVISKGAGLLAHLALPKTKKINDPMSGLFMVKKVVVENAGLKPSGYKILLEVLVMGTFQNVAEVPYQFRLRAKGESKLSTKEQINYLKHLLSLMRRSGEITRFIKFGLVGGSGILVNEGLLWILKQYAGLPLALASGIAIETSILSNFLLNDTFTFADRREPGTSSFFGRLGKFNLVSLVGLVINLSTLLVLTHLFNIHYLLANLVGIIIAFLWNYLANRGWTWKQ